MLTDLSILYARGNDGIDGVALVWVIDGECLYDIPVWQEYSDMFLTSEEVIDISSEYPDYAGITIKFIKNSETVGELQTSEYFGSILLSNPTVLKLSDYPFGRYVQSPNALFDGEKFVITNRDMTGLLPWHPSHPRASENDQV
jgi:hypothetical protein